MRSKIILSILFAGMALFISAIPLLTYHPSYSSPLVPQTSTVVYIPTTALFPNPERGLYHHTETHSPDYTPLELAVLQNYRQIENISLILWAIYLEDYVSKAGMVVYYTATTMVGA